MDDKLEKKIRIKQAKLIKESNRAVSFSKVVNELLDDALNKAN